MAESWAQEEAQGAAHAELWRCLHLAPVPPPPLLDVLLFGAAQQLRHQPLGSALRLQLLRASLDFPFVNSWGKRVSCPLESGGVALEPPGTTPPPDKGWPR